jgi:hypothetical protein
MKSDFITVRGHKIPMSSFSKQQAKTTQMKKDVKSGKITQQDYLTYYYSVPSHLTKLYGLPKSAPKFKDRYGRY